MVKGDENIQVSEISNVAVNSSDRDHSSVLLATKKRNFRSSRRQLLHCHFRLSCVCVSVCVCVRARVVYVLCACVLVRVSVCAYAERERVWAFTHKRTHSHTCIHVYLSNKVVLGQLVLIETLNQYLLYFRCHVWWWSKEQRADRQRDCVRVCL